MPRAKRLEAARVCAFAARISTFAEHHLEENCSRQLAAARRWPMAWPPFRRSVRTAHGAGFRINWPRPCKARARGGNLDHFGEEIRFENDSVLLAMAGIIATRAESAEAALATGAVSQAYIVIFLVVFFA